MRTSSRLLVVGLALALAPALAPCAQAHANLASASPAPNGHVDANVTLLTVRFTEEVERSFTSVDVRDVLTRASMVVGPVLFDDAHPDTIRRSLKPLPDGVYEVAWQALSRDSHSTRGTFAFSVGAAQLASPQKVVANQHTDDLGVMLREGSARFLYYMGAFVAVGLPFFHLVVDRAPAPRRAALVALAGSMLALLAAYAGLFLLADRTGLGFVASASTVAGTSFDWRATLAGGAAVAFVVALVLGPRPWVLGAGGALALASLVAAALGSHASADASLRDVSIAADALHLAMGALWIGGVIALVMASRGRSADETGALVARFTPLAIASVAIVLATGTYASLRRIPAWSDLWTTTYGELVSAKLLLLAALVGFGAFHKQVMGPRLRAGTAQPRTFRRALAAEALVMTLVLVAAGALASSSPPDSQVETGHQGQLPFVTLNSETPATHVVLMVAPNPVRVGIQNVTIQLHSLRTTPVGPNAGVSIKIAPPGAPEPGSLVDPGPTRVANDEWTSQNGYFTSAGDWSVWVLVQRPEVSEVAKVRFTVSVAA